MAGTVQSDAYTDSAGSGAPSFTYGLKSDSITNLAGTGPSSFPYGIISVGNVAANDSNVVFTSSSNRVQVSNPTAARTHTLPSTGISAGDVWYFINQSAFLITLNASGGTLVDYVVPNGTLRIVCVSSTPTVGGNWLVLEATSQENAYTPAVTDTSSTLTMSTKVGYWWRVRQHMHIRIGASGGNSSGAGAVYLPPPSGYSINSSVLATLVGGNIKIGDCQTFAVETLAQFAAETGVYWASGTTTLGGVIKRPATSANYVGTQIVATAELHATFVVPITGWN